MLINKVNAVSLPYHGLVTENKLPLSNGQQIQYPGLSTGDTQLVAIPNYPNIPRTSEQEIFEQLNGLEWRSYALVSDNHLGAANLGLDWLLYIDPNQVVWYLKLGFNVSDNECEMNCRVETVFGRFGGNYPSSSKILARAKTSFIGPGKLKKLNRSYLILI